jgi:hypothetical protein
VKQELMRFALANIENKPLTHFL